MKKIKFKDKLSLIYKELTGSSKLICKTGVNLKCLDLEIVSLIHEYYECIDSSNVTKGYNLVTLYEHHIYFNHRFIYFLEDDFNISDYDNITVNIEDEYVDKKFKDFINKLYNDIIFKNKLEDKISIKNKRKEKRVKI